MALIIKPSILVNPVLESMQVLWCGEYHERARPLAHHLAGC